VRNTEAALDGLAGPLEIFFRDDDAGWGNRELFRLLDLFGKFDMPLDLAAIPAAIDRETANELMRQLEHCPWLGLHQHGYCHVNHEPEGTRKCEFGTARSQQRQIADIVAGRERLRDLTGAPDPIFTPPWNRCGPHLLEALPAHGFALFSADRRIEDQGAAIAQLPVSFDWERAMREDRLDEALGKAISTAEHPFGIMLHHAVMDDASHDRLATLLGHLASNTRVVVRKMKHWIPQ